MSDLVEQIGMLIDRGGVVMIPLLVLSFVSLALIIERLLFWIATNGSGRVSRLAVLNDALRRGDRRACEGLLKGDRTPFGEVARRLVKGGATESVAIEAVEDQRGRFERYMNALSTIITAAPLLGILGTVIGIIQSFKLLGEQSTLADPREISAGIASALITTAFGLVIALFTLFPYMHFRGQVERALGRMESVIAAAEQGSGGTTKGAGDAPAESGAKGAT